jgi:predicted CxxxxCH...CXXCH cytochrome family protein
VIFSTNPTVTGGLYAGSPAMLDAYGACTNVYCHSNVQTSPPGGPLTYKTINWGTSYGGDMGCNLCHEGPADHYNEPLTGISSGSHPKHAANRIYCATCHANDITQDPDPATAGYACAACHTSNGPNVTHANHAVDVNIVTKYSGAYTGTPAPGDAYGSCASTYCHSSGVSVRTTSIPMTMSAAWNSGTLACNACHGNTTYPAPNNAMPDYPNGTPKENSHEAHVISSGIPCQNCHAGTTANGMTIANAALHVNKTYDTQAAGSFNGKAISFAYTAATTTAAGSCSSISCHGGNAAAWGATLQCQDCHAGAVDVDDFSGTFWSDGTTGEISTSEWRATGHGRPAASGNYASGNPPAVLTTATTTNVKDSGCQFCHDSAVSHMNSANPFRLKNISSATWGKNGNCQVCHAAGSEGMTVDGVLRNGARKVGSNHYGSKHSTSAAGGQFCWDCHDPHGDGNIFMVHAAVAKTSDANTGAPTNTVATVFNAFAAGTDYARSAAPFTGVCNVCHVSTGHYTSTSGDGHNETVRCTQCHQHTDGFRPAGDNCSDCHSSAGGQTPGAIPDAYHAKHVQTAYAGKAALGDYGNYTTNQWYRYSSTGGVPDMGCGYCHPQNSATHMNGVVNLNFGPADAGAGGTLKAKNNATQTYSQNSRTSVTCSSVYCHSDGYFDGTRYGYKTSPEWYGGAYAGDKCAGCHANSPTSSAAHAAHVVGIHYKTIYTGATGLATAGNTDTSSHGYTDGNGNELTSTTINCNVCHYSTVTMPANDNNTVCSTCHSGSNLKGAMAVASVSSSHVNGAVDVAFAPVQVRSKAQLRDNITTVAELNNSWTRTNGYKTANSTDVSNGTPTYSSGSCSSVACHNGNTVAWTSGSLSCNACHTALPR